MVDVDPVCQPDFSIMICNVCGWLDYALSRAEVDAFKIEHEREHKPPKADAVEDPRSMERP